MLQTSSVNKFDGYDGKWDGKLEIHAIIFHLAPPSPAPGAPGGARELQEELQELQEEQSVGSGECVLLIKPCVFDVFAQGARAIPAYKF